MSGEPSLIIDASNADLLDTIVLGAGFRASGGGGPISAGRVFAEKIKDLLINEGKTIKIIDPENVPDDAWCATIASMGSPVALAADGVSFAPFMNSWKEMDTLVQGMPNGAPLQYVMPVEIGAWNSLAPFVVSMMTDDIMVVNGEGAGRAVPTLDLTRLSYVSSNPTVIASKDENYDDATRIGLFIDDVDTVQDLAGAILPTPEFNSIAGVALWPLKGHEMKEYVVGKTYTDIIIPTGEIMKTGLNQENPIEYLISQIPEAKLIVQGVVTEKKTVTSKALDLLNVTVEGIDNDGNELTTVVFGMNENIFTYDSNMALPAIVGPDSECWATLQQPDPLSGSSTVEAIQPLDNTDIQEGMNVFLIGIPSNPVTAQDEKMLARWRETMKTLGYAGEQKSGLFQ